MAWPVRHQRLQNQDPVDQDVSRKQSLAEVREAVQRVGGARKKPITDQEEEEARGGASPGRSKNVSDLGFIFEEKRKI